MLMLMGFPLFYSQSIQHDISVYVSTSILVKTSIMSVIVIAVIGSIVIVILFSGEWHIAIKVII